MHSPLVVWQVRTRIVRGEVHTEYALLIRQEESGITEYSNRYAHPLTKGHVDLHTRLRCD
jgi:hypothetical protein